MSCNGCRVLRKGCSEDCPLRPCLSWIAGGDAQGHATVFLAKFFGRASLLGFVQGVPESQRANLFQSLLYEACGRTISPIYGAVGLLWSGHWSLCQQAVERVLKTGSATDTQQPTSVPLQQPSSGKSSPLPPGTPSSPPVRVPSPKMPRISPPEVLDDSANAAVAAPPKAAGSQLQPAPVPRQTSSPLPAPWLLGAAVGTSAAPLGANEKLFLRGTTPAQGVPISNLSPFNYWPVSLPFAAQLPGGFPVRGPYVDGAAYRPFGVGGGVPMDGPCSSTEAYMMAAAMFQSYAGVSTPELESMKMMYAPYGMVPSGAHAQAQAHEGGTSGSAITIARGQPSSAQGPVAVRTSSADMEGVEPSVNNNNNNRAAASVPTESQARGAGGALRNGKCAARGSGSAVVAPVPRRLNAATSSSPFARAFSHGPSSPPSPGAQQHPHANNHHHHSHHHHQQQQPQQPLQQTLGERDDISSVESVDVASAASIWTHGHLLQGSQSSMPAPHHHHHHHHQPAITVLH